MKKVQKFKKRLEFNNRIYTVNMYHILKSTDRSTLVLSVNKLKCCVLSNLNFYYG